MATSGHKFWRPGTARPADLPPVDREPHREASSVVYNPNAKLSIAQQRRRLPIYVRASVRHAYRGCAGLTTWYVVVSRARIAQDERRQLLYLVERYGTVVVCGHTGCGKTTQIPQYLHEAGWTADGHVVACTQPRRVAATAVAERVADELGCDVGGTVGYAVRFDDRFDASASRILYMTDGRMVRELMADPTLSRYSVVMVDEAHERSVTTDILLGLLKKVRARCALTRSRTRRCASALSCSSHSTRAPSSVLA